MWKRVWAEIKYYKKLFIVCYLLTLPALLSLSTEYEVRFLVALMTLTSFFAAIWLFQKRGVGEDNRDRMHICMPVTLPQIAISRVLVFLVFLCSFILLYLFIIVFVSPESNTPIHYFGIISWFGIMLSYYVLLELGYDLKYFATGIKKIILQGCYFLLLAFLALVFYDLFTKQISLVAPVRRFLWNALFSGSGALFYMVILVVLTITKTLVFCYRHTHVEKV